jgi:protein-tyrosine kinase
MSKLKKALERAKEARGDHGSPLGLEGQGKPRHPKLDPTESDKPIQEIKVNYSRTKVLNIDPRKLKENKIFSHIKEDGMAEQITILKTQLLNKLEQINGNTLMVTSAYPGEGKTFMSINLAFSIAQELHRTVLLVDCDLRHPDAGHVDFTSDYFGVNIDKGLSDYLLGQAELEDILLNPGIDRLTILPGGRPILNSTELLSSARMEMLVSDMKQRYGKNRIVIFDSPSILKISDPLAFSRFVDGILLVVEIKKSSAKDIKKVMSLLKDRVILGTILNKVKNN